MKYIQVPLLASNRWQHQNLFQTLLFFSPSNPKLEIYFFSYFPMLKSLIVSYINQIFNYFAVKFIAKQHIELLFCCLMNFVHLKELNYNDKFNFCNIVFDTTLLSSECSDIFKLDYKSNSIVVSLNRKVSTFTI